MIEDSVSLVARVAVFLIAEWTVSKVSSQRTITIYARIYRHSSSLSP